MNMIERLKELEAAASPGPWEMYLGTVIFNKHNRVVTSATNAALIAEMRNALPKLLARLEKLESENAAYVGVVAEFHRVQERNRKLVDVVEAAKEYVKNTTTPGYTYFDRHEEHLLGKMAVAVAALEQP